MFTRRLQALGLEEALPQLQAELMANPDAGDVEPGTGGLRKTRMPDPARAQGKRGGARVHYLWLSHKGRIYLMYVYGKNEAAKLTSDQKRQLSAAAARIKAEN